MLYNTSRKSPGLSLRLKTYELLHCTQDKENENSVIYHNHNDDLINSPPDIFTFAIIK